MKRIPDVTKQQVMYRGGRIVTIYSTSVGLQTIEDLSFRELTELSKLLTEFIASERRTNK